MSADALQAEIERILWEEMRGQPLAKDVPSVAGKRIADVVMATVVRLREERDENDGYAKMHAAEVNELRAELAAVLDRDTVARDRERYFRWYNEAEDRAQQARLRFAERVEELEEEIRRLHNDNAHLDTALFESYARPFVVHAYGGTCTRCKKRPGSQRTSAYTATGTVLTGCVCDECWPEVIG